MRIGMMAFKAKHVKDILDDIERLSSNYFVSTLMYISNKNRLN